MRRTKVLLIVWSVLLPVLACNAPLATPATLAPGTLTFPPTQAREESGASATATFVPPASLPPSATFPPTATSLPTLPVTLTAGVVQVSVSVNTNCRSGPGKEYDWLGDLNVGETAEVVGRYPPANYWIIRNPDGAGTCWLWGEYARVIGDINLLPLFTPPPSPTPILVRTTIWGYIYYDDNRNGRKDAGEAGVPDYPMQLTATEFGPPLMETTTDASGRYVFHPTPGTYWVVYAAGGPAFCPPSYAHVTVVAGVSVRRDWGILPCSPYDPSCTCP